MELGTPGIKSTPDGWLNRCLGEKRERRFALSRRRRRPANAAHARRRSAGADDFFALKNFACATRRWRRRLQRLYANVADPLFRQGGNSLFEAMAQLRAIEAKIPPSSGELSRRHASARA